MTEASTETRNLSKIEETLIDRSRSRSRSNTKQSTKLTGDSIEEANKRRVLSPNTIATAEASIISSGGGNTHEQNVAALRSSLHTEDVNRSQNWAHKVN